MWILHTFTVILALHPVRETQYGKVKGDYVDGLIEKDVELYRSIPFAAPPTGENRWRRPQPPQNWKGEHYAALERKVCPQGFELLYTLDPRSESEDCLYLDVYTPRNPKTKGPLAVMFWIYGGGYRFGDKNEFGFYNAQKIVSEHEVVVVSINYRLDVFGFLGHSVLAEEDDDGMTGNYGIMDQIFALEWVRTNIANFNGNPDSVTIWGESAGAFSVCTLLVNSKAKGLFSNAILESADCGSGLFHTPLKARERYSEIWTKKWGGCDYEKLGGDEWKKCIRSAPVRKLLMPAGEIPKDASIEEQHTAPLANVMPWGPTIDGSTAGLTDTPLHLMWKGEWAKVPLLGGYNLDGGSMFVPMVNLAIPDIHGRPSDYNSFLAITSRVYPFNVTSAKLVADYYYNNQRNKGEKYGKKLLAMMLRDFVLKCPSRSFYYNAMEQGVPVYSYITDVKEPAWPITWVLGAHHGVEMQLVFDNPTWLGSVVMPDTPKNKVLGDKVSTYWANFAKTSDPNGEGLNHWAVYNESEPNMMIDENFPTLLKQQIAECDFLDTIPFMWKNSPYVHANNTFLHSEVRVD